MTATHQLSSAQLQDELDAPFSITQEHVDFYGANWPVNSDKTLTAWVPLQATPLSMGPLAFCAASHRSQVGRDLGISDESELALTDALQDFPLEESSYDLGDVSFHSGWTFHRAGANTTDRAREVMTVIYMDEKIYLSPPRNRNQVVDMERWTPGQHSGEQLASPLNPVIYTSHHPSA